MALLLAIAEDVMEAGCGMKVRRVSVVAMKMGGDEEENFV